MNRFGIGVRIDGHDVGLLVLAGGTIDYGRSTVFEQPGAPTCHLTLFTQQGYPQNPAAWFDYGVGTWGDPSHFVPTHDTDDTYAGPRNALYVGAPVWVSATTSSHFVPTHDTDDIYAGSEFRRFTGKVDAIEYGYYAVDVVCSGTLEEWARVGIVEPPTTPIGGAADSVVAADLATLTPSPTVLHIQGDPGPGMIEYVSADYPLCLLPTLQQIADDADALLYQNREGNVTYRTRNWAPPIEYTVPSGIIDAETLAMTLELGDMQNSVMVECGTSVPRAMGMSDDAASIAQYGLRAGLYTTALADNFDASAHAATIIIRTAPAWHMPDLDLHMNLATDRDVFDICQLEQGVWVIVNDLPTGAPVPYYTAHVLGWTEDLSSNEWVITMHLAPLNLGADPVQT
jgi:chitodextrinase